MGKQGTNVAKIVIQVQIRYLNMRGVKRDTLDINVKYRAVFPIPSYTTNSHLESPEAMH